MRVGERDVRVIAEADVLVAGGGSAGLAAAVAAARSGARTILIERYGFLGGNATSAWVGTICGLYRTPEGDRICRGFAGEWADALAAERMGFGPVPFKQTAVFMYVPWGFKRLADRVVRAEPNLTTLLHSTITEIVRDGARISGAVIGSKRGPLAVTAGTFIDCTGDADLAFHAGAGTDGGGDGQRQFPSMQFLMSNVDVASAYGAGLEKLQELLRTTGQEPEWNLSRTGGAVLPTGRPGEIYGAMTRIAVEGRAPDMTDPVQATAAEFAGRDEAEKAGRFLVANMPGFSESYLVDTPTQIGVRETRRAIGEYVLTVEDVESAARFDDAVAACSWPQEYHVRGKETEYRWLEPGGWFQVPYRSLVVRGIENLFVAGRCMSATHDALASTRVIAPSMAQGEAAGVAAAMCARSGVSARDLDVERLQSELRARGAFF
jgi:choline dehydrogenase-like flavoprotein